MPKRPPITKVRLNKVNFAPPYFTFRKKGESYGGPKGSGSNVMVKFLRRFK